MGVERQIPEQRLKSLQHADRMLSKHQQVLKQQPTLAEIGQIAEELLQARHRIADHAAEVAELRLEVEMRDATLSMAVARLGGIVEGNPTGRHNFLQRIDELVAKEDNLQRENSILWQAISRSVPLEQVEKLRAVI